MAARDLRKKSNQIPSKVYFCPMQATTTTTKTNLVLLPSSYPSGMADPGNLPNATKTF